MLPSKSRGSEVSRLVGMLVLCVCHSFLMIFFRFAEIPASTAQTNSNSEALIQISPGSPIRRELAIGTKDVFVISAAQNTVLRFSIEKGDLVLSTSVYGPTGTKLLEHVSQDFENV